MSHQLEYIDAQARDILNNYCQNEDPELPDPDDLEFFTELFQDAVESATFGAPRELFPDHYPGNDDDYTDEQMEANCRQDKLIADLIYARIYQLINAEALTE